MKGRDQSRASHASYLLGERKAQACDYRGLVPFGCPLCTKLAFCASSLGFLNNVRLLIMNSRSLCAMHTAADLQQPWTDVHMSQLPCVTTRCLSDSFAKLTGTSFERCSWRHAEVALQHALSALQIVFEVLPQWSDMQPCLDRHRVQSRSIVWHISMNITILASL